MNGMGGLCLKSVVVMTNITQPSIESAHTQFLGQVALPTRDIVSRILVIMRDTDTYTVPLEVILAILCKCTYHWDSEYGDDFSDVLHDELAMVSDSMTYPETPIDIDVPSVFIHHLSYVADAFCEMWDILRRDIVVQYPMTPSDRVILAYGELQDDNTVIAEAWRWTLNI